jgi:hypothetical protein
VMAANSPIDPMYESAEALAKMGFPVFPVGVTRKPFAGTHGFYDATVNREKVRAMWVAHPGANIAIRTGAISDNDALLVIDVDPRNDGPTGWNRIRAGRDIPETLRVTTGRDGTHLYFIAPLEKDYPKDLCSGVDIKCVGGYVVAPPSSHEQGHPYAWENEGTPIARAPEWLLSEIAERRKEVRRWEGQFKDKLPEAIIQGGRDIALTSVAGKLRRMGLSAGEIHGALNRLNADRCKPPLEDKNVAKIAESVGRYEPAEDVTKPAASRFAFLTLEEMTEKLGPIPWVCRDLRLAPGFPTMVAGYGFAGKTVSCQQLLLAKACGKLRGLERFAMGSAERVVHIDWDQGRRTTIERYQRLAYAYNLDLSEIMRGGYLDVSVLPDAFLNEKSIEIELAAILNGAKVCLIDSMTSALPGVDENTSAIAQYLYMLGRVSERTGCCIIVLHHFRKGDKTKDADPAQLIRGNSAIFNAVSTAYAIVGTKGEPTVWQCVKQRLTGVTVDDFYTTVVDVGEEVGDMPPPGLRVHTTEPGSDAQVQKRIEKAAKRKLDIDRRIKDAVRLGNLKSANDIYEVVAGNKSDVLARIRYLMDNGTVFMFQGKMSLANYPQEDSGSSGS